MNLVNKDNNRSEIRFIDNGGDDIGNIFGNILHESMERNQTQVVTELDTEDCIKNPTAFLKHSYFEIMAVLKKITRLSLK